MIVRTPTGLYSTVLPKSNSDDTSVVYTISSMDPPRSTLAFNMVPAGAQTLVNDIHVEDLTSIVGELLFTIDYNSNSILAQDNRAVAGMLVTQDTDKKLPAQNVEIGNSLQYVDYDVVGIDNTINIDANVKSISNGLLKDIKALQTQKSRLETDVSSYQKIVTEASRVLLALDVVKARGGNVTSEYNTITRNMNSAISARDVASNNIENINAQIAELQDSIRDLSYLMR